MRRLSTALLAGVLAFSCFSVQAEPWGKKHEPTFTEQVQETLHQLKNNANQYMDTFSHNLHNALHELHGSSNDLLVRLDKNVHQSLHEINKTLNKNKESHEKPTKNPHTL